ncbi:nitrate respiration regulation accessory nitrate sensor NreA [Staphylococcus caeli]|uniref:nitrate respiration regulation accessory nitrate sensor NreA n=1 Tax=Staphylococcus caeli TaxID=2201815 RepID=UPI003F546205
MLNALSLNEHLHYQAVLDSMRVEEGFDFAGIAFYEQESHASPIKWCYASGNLNERYKLIVLRKGKGLAGNVMKTGKRMIIENVAASLSAHDQHKYPIVLCEQLTAMIAIPLWYDRQVYGVLLLGQRNHRPLPKNHESISFHNKLGVFSEED